MTITNTIKEIERLRLSVSSWKDSARVATVRAKTAEANLTEAMEVIRPLADIERRQRLDHPDTKIMPVSLGLLRSCSALLIKHGTVAK